MSKSKKIFVFVLLIAVVMMPMFAKDLDTTSGNYKLDLSFIKNAVNLIVGVFAGGYVLLKAAMDIFHAVRNSSEDPNGLKKAIGGLVLNIAILAAFMFVINYVLSAAGDTLTSGENASASADFMTALSGALVQLN